MPCWNYLLWRSRHNPYGFIFIPYLIVKSLVHLEVLRFFTKTNYPRDRQRLRPRYGEAPTFTSDVIMAPFATRAVSIRNILFLKPTPNSPVHVDPTFIFIHCIYFYQVIWCEIKSTNHLKIMTYPNFECFLCYSEPFNLRCYNCVSAILTNISFVSWINISSLSQILRNPVINFTKFLVTLIFRLC